jgi:hypothetical protein
VKLLEYLDKRAERRAKLVQERWKGNAAGSSANIRDAIGVVLIAAFIGAISALFWKAIPQENADIITYMLGQLSGFVSAVVALHYVQKAGEKELDAARTDNTSKFIDVLQKQQESSAPPAPDAGKAAADAAQETADAAAEKADEIAKEAKP